MVGLEFRLLGPLEVRYRGVPVPVTAAHQRAVLAALLLQPNQVVPLDRLIDLLWGDAPPASAARTLQNLMSRLRRRLPEPGSRALVTRAPGYLIQIEPDRIDAYRFEQLLRQGRAALAAGDPAGGRELLEAAAGRWRGPALADVSAERLVRVERPRLAELRQQAAEELIEARLQLGRHPEVLAELRAMVAEHPLRERPHGQLMRALAGTGRRADALAAYRTARELLTEQLGIEPGPELQRLHLALLRGQAEPGPAPAPETPAPEPPPPPVVPAQLPADVPGFTGRAAQLAELDRLAGLTGGGPAAPVVAVVGTAGIGKTALALRWSHQVRDRFPDGQLYLDLLGYSQARPLPPVEALGQFLRALGVPADQVPADPQEAAGRYRTLLTGRRVLVLLDNARDPEQVRLLLPGDAAGLVLVTSRDRLDGLVIRPGAERLALDGMSGAEAHELLTGGLGPERVAAEPAATSELARLCGYLPLALRIATANLAARPHHRVAEYAARLSAGDPLSALAVAGDAGTAVRAAFEVSYAAVPAPAARLFRLVGLVPGVDFPVAAAAALAGAGLAETGALLDRLAAAHLLQEVAGGRYRAHDLLRRYAAELAGAEPAADRATATDRLYGWYLAAAAAAAGLLYPERPRLPGDHPPVPAGSGDHHRPEPAGTGWDTPAQALAWLEVEGRNLVLAAERAARLGPRSMAWRLADTLRGYLIMQLRLPEWRALARAGEAAAAAERDLPAQAAMQLGLGEAGFREQRYPVAIDHFTRAAQLSEHGGWTTGLVSALANLGTAYQHLGRRDEAAGYYTRALELAPATGRSQLHGHILNNLGNTYWELGRLEAATEHYRQALELHRAGGSRRGHAMILNNLGELTLQLGQFDQAQAYLTEALTINQESGNRASEAGTMCKLAELHCRAGRPEPATELAETALALASEAGDRLYEAGARSTLAMVRRETGRLAEAVSANRAALRLARRIGHPLIEAQVQLELAHCCLALGRVQPAAGYASAALTIARDRGYRLVEDRAAALLADLPPGPGGSARAAESGGVQIAE